MNKWPINKLTALLINVLIIILILASPILAVNTPILAVNSFTSPNSLASPTLEELLCRSNPALPLCQKNLIIPCSMNSDCHNSGRMFCDAQGRPSRFDCLLRSGLRQCIKSEIHSACALWMPWYDRILFSCTAANQLAWAVDYGFCHLGQFCSIKHSNNFQQAVCYDFLKS